eukprot:CAMPEP_0182593518 /NCGR_PEP_ID=MMETSP1324-20130603/78155_1 /TAXON_ID=236786 /ORGANISM="Florenciella sp., Strain RCC1587" /LENGTH=98 /DNA_ID=CAMNT_0024810987 /DNA_START=97 /DNA_END=394 /DNA_ORIENTATION=-
MRVAQNPAQYPPTETQYGNDLAVTVPCVLMLLRTVFARCADPGVPKGVEGEHVPSAVLVRQRCELGWHLPTERVKREGEVTHEVELAQFRRYCRSERI